MASQAIARLTALALLRPEQLMVTFNTVLKALKKIGPLTPALDPYAGNKPSTPVTVDPRQVFQNFRFDKSKLDAYAEFLASKGFEAAFPGDKKYWAWLKVVGKSRVLVSVTPLDGKPSLYLRVFTDRAVREVLRESRRPRSIGR